MRPSTLLHTADVHLGISADGAHGLEEQAFSRAIDFAIETSVDAILIAGDLFDHARVSDDLLAWTAKQLDRAERPVVLLVGNHDALHDASVHHRFQVSERCPRVQLLEDPDGSIIEVPDTDLVIWGRAMVEHEPSFRPLAGVPARPQGKWAVVAAHGLVRADDRPTHHASPMSATEIDSIDWHYVALGHHHGHKFVRETPVPVVYPGAIARSLRGEPGAVMVSFSPDTDRATAEWISLAAS